MDISPASGRNIISKGGKKPNTLTKVILRDYQLYLLVLPAVFYLILFNYIPMYGVQIAFKNYIAAKGILGSPWIGFGHFERFFNSYQFWTVLKNTLGISLYTLIAGFPAPIILALMLHHTKNQRFKTIVQTVTYAPHFISTVVLVGMLYLVLSPTSGFVNHIIAAVGGEPKFFMAETQSFKHIYVLSGIWQGTGFGSIIYLAALSSVSPELYEAAKIDGASTFKQILNIDLPGILPTAVILLVLNAGSIMNVGFQKAFLMQNPLTEQSQEIIATYVYKAGLINTQYGYSAAIGLFNTVINIILLITVNQIAKKLTENSLW